LERSDGDPVTFLSAYRAAPTTEQRRRQCRFLYYTNTGALPDTLTYTIADIRTNPPAIYRRAILSLRDRLIQTATPVVQRCRCVWRQSHTLRLERPPGGTYYLLLSTKPRAADQQLDSPATNLFDANGKFLLANPLGSAIPSQFYLLQLP